MALNTAVPSAHKATTPPALVLAQRIGCPIKKKRRLCPTEPFDLNERILAAGVF